MKNSLLLLSFFLFSLASAYSQINARLFRTPDVSATHIAFVYGGDLWVVAKEGGIASKLSSPSGAEGFPRFHPMDPKLPFQEIMTATSISMSSPL